MRGVKESGFAFMLPTFLFVGTLLVTVAVGVVHAFAAGGHPLALATPPPAPSKTMQYLTLWLLMKAFAGGCAAMTGVEAVSNGVTAFREPKSSNANRALTVIINLCTKCCSTRAGLCGQGVWRLSAMADPMAHGYRGVPLSIEGCGGVWARVVLLP